MSVRRAIPAVLIIALASLPASSHAGLGSSLTTVGAVAGRICYSGPCGFVDPQRFEISWSLVGGFSFASEQFLGRITMRTGATYQGTSRANLDPFTFASPGLTRRIKGSCTGRLTFPGPVIDLTCTGSLKGGKTGTARITIVAFTVPADLSSVLFGTEPCVCEDFLGVYGPRTS